MTLTLKAPSQLFAIGLFALTGLAAANPVANLVDCTDSFWAIACSEGFGDANPEPVDLYGVGNPEPVKLYSAGNSEPVNLYGDSNSEPVEDVILGDPIRIDNDPVCVEIDGGFIVCHT